MSINAYLGIDVGSVTTKLALVDEKGKDLYFEPHETKYFIVEEKES